MHCYRVARNPQTARVVCSAPARQMSVFPAAFPRFPGNEFAPFFNLIDEHFSRGSVRAFQPRFDVREVQTAYELRGELPGVDQKDINIEFTDEKTMVVKGRSERETTNGSSLQVDTEKVVAAQENELSDTASTSSYQHATVEDDTEGAVTAASEAAPAETPATAAATTETEPEEPSSRYWLSERSVGEFQRTFTFASRVDQDAVKASLKNGILSIVVPKAAIPATKKISVE